MDPHWPNLQCHNQQQQNQQIIPFINCTTQFHEQNPVVNSASESNDLLQQQMRNFWQRQRAESNQANDYRNHSLPLARIKKIMKSDEDVRMISAEAPVLLSKACEMFIQDLTLRSWVCTEESKRRTLQRADISAALSTTDLFDFLVDIVPREKPIVVPAGPSVMPVMVTPHNNLQHQQQQDITMGEGAGVGLTMGLPMQLNNQVNERYEDRTYMQGTWSDLSHQTTWPPPDF